MELGDLKSALVSQMEMQNLEFIQLVFGLFFGSVFPHSAPFLLFWNGNVYFLPLYVVSL